MILYGKNNVTNCPYKLLIYMKKLIYKVDYSSRRLNYLVEQLVMFHKQIMFTKCVNVFLISLP